MDIDCYLIYKQLFYKVKIACLYPYQINPFDQWRAYHFKQTGVRQVVRLLHQFVSCNILQRYFYSFIEVWIRNQ